MPVSSYSRKTYWLFAPSMYPSAICFPSLCCCDMRIFATALRLVCGELPSRLTKQRGSGGSHCLLLLLFSHLFVPACLLALDLFQAFFCFTFMPLLLVRVLILAPVILLPVALSLGRHHACPPLGSRHRHGDGFAFRLLH